MRRQPLQIKFADERISSPNGRLELGFSADRSFASRWFARTESALEPIQYLFYENARAVAQAGTVPYCW
jgi:hypothetical protein